MNSLWTKKLTFSPPQPTPKITLKFPFWLKPITHRRWKNRMAKRTSGSALFTRPLCLMFCSPSAKCKDFHLLILRDIAPLPLITHRDVGTHKRMDFTGLVYIYYLLCHHSSAGSMYKGHAGFIVLMGLFENFLSSLEIRICLKTLWQVTKGTSSCFIRFLSCASKHNKKKKKTCWRKYPWI